MMKTVEEIKEKIIEVSLLKLPKNNLARFYAKKLNNAVITALNWVLEENKDVENE